MKLLPSPDYFRNNVALRNDTLLGVCEALGQDLGINPNWLRVPLATGIIFAPFLMIGIYFALGAVAFASRTLMPNRIEQAQPVARSEAPVAAVNEAVELPRAA
jgi:phage shock protein PspC (stress-responsive transcriptional regulator)